MQQKNIFLLLALSGSVLMMMMVSILFFVPTPSSLSADISRQYAPRSLYDAKMEITPHRDAEQILQTIQSYVRDNDPDTAKKLYDELYALGHTPPMGGEVERLVVR